MKTKEEVRKIIEEHYEKYGIGDTVKQRLNHWESQHPDGYSISHNPTDEQKVAVFEACWYYEAHPEDAILA